jgi:hypothetical protein
VRLQDLDQGGLDQLLRRISDLETATPLRNASVTAGRVRIGGTAVLLVDSSGGVVIHGSLNGDGTISWSGVTTLTGTTNLNGPTTVNGNTSIAGTLDVSGITTLLNNLIVGSGGKITAGVLTIDPAAGRYGGALVSSAAIDVVAPQFYVGTTIVAHGMLVSDAATELYGTVKLFGTSTTTSASNVYWDPTTKLLSRVSSARRFKIRPRKMKIADALLDVPVKEWIDRGARERGEPDVYVPGVIAEEIDAAGGGQFITHGSEGELEGVAYDRLALARTQILNDRLKKALDRIDSLEMKLARLEEKLAV